MYPIFIRKNWTWKYKVHLSQEFFNFSGQSTWTSLNKPFKFLVFATFFAFFAFRWNGLGVPFFHMMIFLLHVVHVNFGIFETRTSRAINFKSFLFSFLHTFSRVFWKNYPACKNFFAFSFHLNFYALCVLCLFLPKATFLCAII